ncbi:MAG: hypothetical protein ACI9SP_004369 [Arenicella sp.]|jgi:hypothetical protein
MDWSSLLPTFLAGGLVGQLMVAWLNRKKDLSVTEFKDQLTRQAEIESWLRLEKYKAYVEMADLASSHHSQSGNESWPSEIRMASVRIHMLFPSGTAPDDLSDAMQNVFFLALNRRLGKVPQKGVKKWNHDFRDQASKLREILASELYKK